MDYSLLLVIEDLGDQSQEVIRRGQVYTSNLIEVEHEVIKKNQVYHFGIIDYLQEYNYEKKTENFFKTKLLNKGEGISAIEPKQYQQRFC